MKNFILASVILLLSSLVFSSCSTSCNGNWYNNRNVYQSPAEQMEVLELATTEAYLTDHLVRN